MRDVAIVRDSNNNEIFFGETIEECKQYCRTNNITGRNGEYIALGTFNETTKYFEIEDYTEI